MKKNNRGGHWNAKARAPVGKPATWLSQAESSWQKDCKGKSREVAEGPLWLEWVMGWEGKKGEVIGPDL